MQENKEVLEYLMSVVDEAERLFSGDPLAEKSDVVEYEFEFPENRIDEKSCMECPLWKSRMGREEYINFPTAKVLCITGAAEPGKAVLKPDALTMYENQMTNVLGLQRSQRALVSLIKCPTDTFSREYADKCKPLLKADMAKFSPRIIILFGTDVARYMLRQEGPFDNIRASVRKRPWHLNGIPLFVTYSQRECITNPSLKKAVFEDLKAIKEGLK